MKSIVLAVCILTLPIIAIADTIVLRDGTTVSGTLANRELVVTQPYTFDSISILTDSDAYESFDVDDILYVVVIDGDARRVVDFETTPPVGSGNTPDAVTAAAPPQHELRLALGMGFPRQPDAFEQGWDNGLYGAIAFCFPVRRAVTPQFGFEYHRFGFNHDRTLGAPVSVDGGVYSVTYVFVGMRLGGVGVFEPRGGPFAELGFGYYGARFSEARFRSTTETFTIPGDHENTWGIKLAVGMDIQRLTLGGEYLYGATTGEAIDHVAAYVGLAIGD